MNSWWAGSELAVSSDKWTVGSGQMINESLGSD